MTGTAIKPNYGIDADRVLAVDAPLAALRRRYDGRYAVDELGTDPHFLDIVAPLGAPMRVHVERAENLPRAGSALIVANRGLGLFEPIVLVLGVRRANGRRLRVVGAPDLPVLGPLLNKLGAIGSQPGDVAALLRAGHLAAAPLGPTWLSAGRGGVWLGHPPLQETKLAKSTRGAGEPPRALLAATLGFPVIPVAVKPGGPLGLPVRAWRVLVGEPLLPPSGTEADDQLAAAEISEAVRDAVHDLLREV
jgi:1-acyl-sn-glycerol-3-phosphate acyltransferase